MVLIKTEKVLSKNGKYYIKSKEISETSKRTLRGNDAQARKI